MRDIAILLMLVAMLPAGMRATNVGAMMWAWVALVSPNEYAYGIASNIPYNKIAVGVTFLSLIFVHAPIVLAAPRFESAAVGIIEPWREPALHQTAAV